MGKVIPKLQALVYDILLVEGATEKAMFGVWVIPCRWTEDGNCKAREPRVESLVPGIWRLRVSEAEQSMATYSRQKTKLLIIWT